MFGSRSLYLEEKSKLISKLTFISDSFDCEIYKLDKNNLKFLPDFLVVSKKKKKKIIIIN